MNQRRLIKWVVCFLLPLVCSAWIWGFYAHREINRQAVFTTSGELARFYKANINYVSTHAVDPDKRRYAAQLEGPRHFVDLERFGDGTLEALPQEWLDFHDTYTYLYCVGTADSSEIRWENGFLFVGGDSAALSRADYRDWYRSAILPMYRQIEHTREVRVPKFSCERVSLVDTMTQHGILPYHLVDMQRRLTNAFRQNNLARVLQLSAEIGHYIGDASVPLHTTENYNGQLTGQRGIHGFWESRIPELFAETEFDMLVGPARYIDDKTSFFRDLVRTSHEHVDSVLLIEADLRRKLPEEMQDCYEERLGRVTRVQCRAFAEAYWKRLDGMVEDRFRTAIHAVGSAWYTAWIDAGSPTLGKEVAASEIVVDSIVRDPSVRTRAH